MNTTGLQDAVPAQTIELSVPGDGRPHERTLTVRFGDFVSALLAAPEPNLEATGAEANASEATNAGTRDELAALAGGADFLHDIFSGGPPLDAPPEGPGNLASYVLSLTDAALDSAHRIMGYEHDLDYDYPGIVRPDPQAAHLRRMMRLTDHLAPTGRAFDSILAAVLAAPPAEDPSASYAHHHGAAAEAAPEARAPHPGGFSGPEAGAAA